MALDPTDDDPSMGQGGPPPPDPMGGAGGGPPGGVAPQPGPGPGMISAARARMGPQISAPGPGNQADSINQIIQAINMLKKAGMGLQPGDKLHSDVYKTIQTLSKHLGGVAGMAPAAGIQKTMIGDQLRDTVKNMLLSRVMGQQGGGQGGPPMPSTPLPGT